MGLTAGAGLSWRREELTQKSNIVIVNNTMKPNVVNSNFTISAPHSIYYVQKLDCTTSAYIFQF